MTRSPARDASAGGSGPKALALAREAVEATPRGRISKKTRAAVMGAYGHKCSWLGCSATDALQIDHAICLELGGLDLPDNMQPLCAPHHKIKTARDLKLIAKSRRLRYKNAGETRTKRPIVSRGFSKLLTKGFDGKVRARRDTAEAAE